MKQAYRLSSAADKDLAHIWAYTCQQWGSKQADTYLKALESTLLTLVRNPSLGKLRPDIHPDYASIIHDKHIIFYRIQHGCIEVARVLHQRMDAASHLDDHTTPSP